MMHIDIAELTIILGALLTAATVDGFGLGGGGGRKVAPRAKSSPLLDEALSAYPFVIKSDEERSDLAGNFNELARLYGDDAALRFVEIMPKTLKFKKDNFAPCLESWTAQFGPEGARAMVGRNPGLLGVPAELTRDAEPSMAFSYVVAYTRPLPKLIAGGLVLALLTGGLR